MMYTKRIYIGPGDKLFPYFSEQSPKSKNLKNVTMFLTRNTATALSKEAKDRHPLENEVLDKVYSGLEEANRRKLVNFAKKERKTAALNIPSMAKTAIMISYARKFRLFSMPTPEKPWLSYEQIDAVLKCTKDPDYYALPAQVNQQSIRKARTAFDTFFDSLAEYKVNPGKYKGRPRMPKYIRKSQSEIIFTSQVSKPIRNGEKIYFTFPGTELRLNGGPADQYQEKLVHIEVCPHYHGYMACITYKDETEMPCVLEDPKRIMGIDVGVDNFLSCATNFPATPFIISGKWLKMENQYFNKERSRLLSELTHGYDSKRSRKNSKRLYNLSRRRDSIFRDFFYKAAHAVCRVAKQRGVELIIVGQNKEQKQGISIGGVNNQNFASIPFRKMDSILECVAAKYGISVIFREESYTSKASLIDMDKIPTYNKGTEAKYVFSGKRVHRGLYRTKEGILFNADINGAGNIIRKEYPEAFDKDMDMSYLWKTTLVISRKELIKSSKTQKNGNRTFRKMKEQRRSEKHRRSQKKFLYMKLFEAETEPRYAKALLLRNQHK